MTRLEDVLSRLGLDPLEIKGYMELHQRGVLAAAAVAKRLGVPRTTAYTMLERLFAKGLIKATTRKGVKSYIAESPDTIGHIFSQRVTALDSAHKEFLQLLPLLREKSARTASSPRLAVMEGQDGLQSLLRDMLHYGNLQTCAVWPIRKMMEVLSPEFFRFHNLERIRRDIYTRAVWPSSEVVSVETFPFMGWGSEFKREIRVAPESMTYELGYWIYANKVAFISSARESYGFLIQSEELAQTLTVQFELLWRDSVPLKFDRAAIRGFLKEL
jgi:sugar-specific transcriptional regulator TrmB